MPLAEQNPALWNRSMVGEAETLWPRARSLRSSGRYQSEAALQSAHVYRCRTGHNNWAAVLELYHALLALSASSVVAINRALAVAKMQGARAALDSFGEVTDVRL
jgi:RNA polymerase sigma-70 factor (ECF subfamily)